MDLRFSVYDGLKHLIWPLEIINESLPKSGRIIDLGCGEGVIAKYLASVPERYVIGVDHDYQRLPKSNLKNLRFECFDINNFNFGQASGVVLSDVLHHLGFKKQEKLLRKIYLGLKKGGVLTVKEIDGQEFIRSRLSRFWDLLFYPKDEIYYSKSSAFKEKLEKLGFKVTIIRTSRLFPGSTTLYISTK